MKRRICIWLSGLIVAGVLGFAAAWILCPFPAGKLSWYPAGVTVLDHAGDVLRVTLGENDVDCEPVSLEQAGPWLGKAVVAVEDHRFWRHRGLDVLAIGRALRQNLAKWRVVSGASTISTQVIRLVEPRPRTVLSKLIEALHALQMERRFTKERILQQYLNRAPFGSNLIGVEAASRCYFGKSAADLSLSEAALLAGLPQSPTRLRPDLHSAAATKRRDHVLERMLACGYISEAQMKLARMAPVECAWQSWVFRAPHFCDLVLSRYPTEKTLHTTLNWRLQQIAEEALQLRTEKLSAQGIHGGAIVILDVRDCAVRALVGSPDFRDVRHAGQVNGAAARRSPGSALKPFVFARAIDQGLCTPATVLPDVPMTVEGLTPRNFDHEFSGPVSVREALVRSLNIPALRIMQLVGQEDCVRLFRRAGFMTLDKPASHYGLGIVLGSGEVTLLDLVNAYGSLARGGAYCPARLLETTPTVPPVKLFSAEAAYMIADILSGEERTADVWWHVADVKLPKVAWKTGTSPGYRDAWAIAYNPDYVVGVWLGNPDGRPAPSLVGRQVASPLVGEIFRRLYPSGDAPWFSKPEGLSVRWVCPESGLLPTAYCRATIPDFAIVGVSSTASCPVHQHRQPSWPLEIGSFLRQHGQCDASTRLDDTSRALTITSPATGETFARWCGNGQRREDLALAASTSTAAETIYWFVDGELFRTSLPGQRVFWPLQSGAHVISCSDSFSHSDSVRVLVE